MKFLLTILILILITHPCFAYTGTGAQSFEDINFPHREKIIIKNNMGNGEAAVTINTVENKSPGYLIQTIEENGNKIKILLDKESLKPIFSKKVDKNNKLLAFTDYDNKNKVIVSFPQEKFKKVINIPDESYDRFSLYYLFRGFPFEEKEKITFSLVMHDPGNIRVEEMYVKNKGIETIEVPAGKFTCYKLEMGVEGNLKAIIWPYKYRFWFTKDFPHHFVKYEGQEIDRSKLVNELLSYTPGTTYIGSISY